VIKNVVIHLVNEQPMLADIEALPLPSDVAFVCTNLRTMNNTRPVFVDHSESTFVFPYAHIRFVELPTGKAGQGRGAPGDRQRADAAEPAAPPPPEAELEIDEDFLRRVRDI
jgi:hypothetical protein